MWFKTPWPLLDRWTHSPSFSCPGIHHTQSKLGRKATVALMRRKKYTTVTPPEFNIRDFIFVYLFILRESQNEREKSCCLFSDNLDRKHLLERHLCICYSAQFTPSPSPAGKCCYRHRKMVLEYPCLDHVIQYISIYLSILNSYVLFLPCLSFSPPSLSCCGPQSLYVTQLVQFICRSWRFSLSLEGGGGEAVLHCEHPEAACKGRKRKRKDSFSFLREKDQPHGHFILFEHGLNIPVQENTNKALFPYSWELQGSKWRAVGSAWPSWVSCLGRGEWGRGGAWLERGEWCSSTGNS